MAVSSGLSRLAPHFAQVRPRLLISAAIGGAAYLLAPSYLRAPLRAIAAWDLAVICYLAMALHMFLRSDLAQIRRRAAAQDENAWVILLLTSAAAMFSLLAIVLVLRGAKELTPGEVALHFGLAAGTILCSWLLVHLMFALHYAHGYYQREAGDGSASGPGLQFPGEDPPDYWDFCYFSFVIGMTCQVSDVEVADRRLRRLTLAHGVLAFFFNTIILALSINIAAGLLQ
jgi:uncharacterized membrane protein